MLPSIKECEIRSQRVRNWWKIQELSCDHSFTVLFPKVVLGLWRKGDLRRVTLHTLVSSVSSTDTTNRKRQTRLEGSHR